MGFSFGRLAAGVATGGLSEAYRGINKLNESPQDKKARELASNAAAGWEDVRAGIPGATQPVDAFGNPYGELKFNAPELSYSSNPLAQADIHGYATGPDLHHQGIAAPTDQGTAWKDAASAYNGLNSSWDNANSAYDEFAPDQAGRNAAMGAGGYLANVASGGPDAQAEADYARRAKQAELSRRSNSEAALGQLEQRGMGGSGDALLAQLVNNQGAASDRYQAGLDTNALSQARRDSAATQYGTLGTNLYGQDVNAANYKAGGQDAFSANKLAGRDTFATNRAQGQDTFSTGKNNATDSWNQDVNKNAIDVNKYNADQTNSAADSNWDRGNTVSDTNTALGNQVTTQNKIGSPQQTFENQMAVQSGATGAANNAAAIYAGTAQHPFTDWVMPTVGNLTKAAAPTPKTQ